MSQEKLIQHLNGHSIWVDISFGHGRPFAEIAKIKCMPNIYKIRVDTDRQTDRQMYRQTDRCTDRQTDRCTDRQTDRNTNICTDRQTDRCTDRQTNRQING